MPETTGEAMTTTSPSLDGVLAHIRADVTTARDLLAVIDALLAAHRPVPDETDRDRCARCHTAQGVREPWPCGEYLAIARVLTGGSDA